MALIIQPLANFPLIEPGNEIASVINRLVKSENIPINDEDIFVITQKIVSKAENRYIDLNIVKPSKRACDLAVITDKDPRLIELILSESNQIIRVGHGVIIVEHRLGFICANAGIDQSNLPHNEARPDLVLLLPVDPNKSAASIRRQLERSFQKKLGVLIIDSHGRAWRNGVVGISIGSSGIPVLSDQRGWDDLFGKSLKITQVAAADELAAAASLVMGQSSEGKPVVHVSGFPYPLVDMPFSDILRSKDKDLFR